MWQERLRRVAAGSLLPWLAATVVIALVSADGAFGIGAGFVLSGAALAIALAATMLSERGVLSAVGRATTGLGPGAAMADPFPQLSPSAQSVRGAVQRLDRAWREHTAGTEARLAAAEAIIEAVPDPLIVLDRQRRIIRTNAASGEFTGPGTDLRDLAAALRNPLLLAAADAVLRGEPARSVEFTLLAPTEQVLRARFARLADTPAPGAAAAILTLHDVTELKRSEQMRADFVANAGHELKTPLAALIGFIETLLGPARDDPAASERFLGIMNEQARRMARLVDDLLSLSRIELNEHVAPTGRVALAPVVDEVARGLELRAAQRKISIVRALPADLPEVQGDRDELAQIVQNLLDNAVKYGRPGSDIKVSGDATAALVRVAVADQGDGIPSEHLPRLTERFYRVDTARSRELGGTGLGLAIVKHIVGRHRGRFEIQSRLGEGSIFTVWLPAAEARRDESAPD